MRTIAVLLALAWPLALAAGAGAATSAAPVAKLSTKSFGQVLMRRDRGVRRGVSHPRIDATYRSTI